MIALCIVIAIIVIIAIFLIWLYNNMVQLRNMVNNAWAQVDVQLQRRLDLIPNLVETVKGYASHERGTLQSVTEARTACMNAQTPADAIASENVLTGALKSLFAVSEAYPDLKANQNFQQLQSQLAETEDKISYMRQSYNDVVMKFNNAIQTFPGVVFAHPMGFTPFQSFDADAAATTAPVVDFGSNGQAQNAAPAKSGAPLASTDVANHGTDGQKK